MGATGAAAIALTSNAAADEIMLTKAAPIHYSLCL